MSHERRRESYARFSLGWNPRQLPGTMVEPYDIREGQVVDARNVFVAPGGSLEWRRNQFSIDAPTGSNVGPVKSLLEYHTDALNQLLAVVRFGAGAPYTARLYRLTTDWPNATPTQTTYGYEVFNNGGTWTAQVTEDADTLLRFAADGIADAEQAKDLLMIALRDGEVPAFYDGTQVYDGYLDAPGAALSAADNSAGVLSSGTYSYYYTFYNPDTGVESMPSRIADLTLTTNDRKVLLTGITDYGDNLMKRVYRAFTSDTLADARGESFYFLTDLQAGTGAGSQEDLTVGWVEHDTEGRLVVGANSAAYTDLEDDDDVYLTKDEGAGSIEEFDYRCTFNFTSSEADAVSILLGAAFEADTYGNWTYGNAIQFTGQVGYGAFELRNVENSVVTPGSGAGPIYITDGETRYLRLARGGGSVTLYVHKASDYSDEPEVHSASDAGTAVQYVYAGSSSGGITTDKMTFEIQHVILDSATEYYDNMPQYALGDLVGEDKARPPDMTMLTWHKDRMYAAGATEGSQSYDGYDEGYWGNVLFFSALDEVHYWPGDHMVVVGDDTAITGLVSWGDHLIIFKENSTWSFTGYAEGSFELEQINSSVGALAKNCQAGAPEGVMWAAADGFYFWNGGELRKLLPFLEQSPWGDKADWPTEDSVPTMAYHDGRFYVLQDGYLLSWEPTTDRWRYQYVEVEDTDSEQTGIRAFASGVYQTHLMLCMAWVVSGTPLITVLHNTGGFANEDAAGSSYSDLHSPVQITLPPLIAGPAERIQPLWIAVTGSWTEHATPTKRVKVFISGEPDYSAVEGDNAWGTTPDAPQGGEKMGVPAGYEYGVGSLKSNTFARLYIQLKGESAVDFRLDAVELAYYLLPSRGS